MQAQGILKKLCVLLEQRGFYRSVYIDRRRLTLNYVKDFSSKPKILKMAFGDKSHLGIEICIEDIKEDPIIMSPCIPNYFKILSSIECFPLETKKFAMDYTKTCDG